MHIPDHFITAPVTAGATLAAVSGVTWAVMQARTDSIGTPPGAIRRTTVLAASLCGFVFAAQMVNVPVAHATSGHLVGAALAAILLGPASAILVMTTVLVVQAVVFGDGGITALGPNILNLAIVAVMASHLVWRLVRRAMPPGTSSSLLAAGLAAWASVVAASSALAVEFALGGVGAADRGAVAVAFVESHTWIGFGEGAVTVGALVVVAALTPRGDDDRTGGVGPPEVDLGIGRSMPVGSRR